MGAFIVVNAEGWVLTSGHIVEEILVASTSATDAADVTPRGASRGRALGAVGGARLHDHASRVSSRCTSTASPTWAVPHRAVRRGGGREYPVFRDTGTAPIEQGMSVCRLGFPFYDVPATLQRGARRVRARRARVPGAALRARRHRRPVQPAVAEDGESSALFIETSTPGLRGQSGGPLLDTTGRVCGVQSHTSHVDLGFDAQYSTDDGP